MVHHKITVGILPVFGSKWMACQAHSDYDSFVPNRAHYAEGDSPDEAADLCIEKILSGGRSLG